MNIRRTSRGRIATAIGALGGAAIAFLTVLAVPGGASTRAAPVNSTPPAITGDAVVGSTLTASSGSWSGTGTITFAFQWQRCDSAVTTCTAIAGATGQTYSVADPDNGDRLRVSVDASNGETATALSQPTDVVVAASAPGISTAPAISGTAISGQTLTTSNGTWAGAPPPTFVYAWERCNSAGASCSVVSGATSSTYALSSADVGYTLRSRVTATNAAGSAQVESNASAVVSGGSGPQPKAQGDVSGTAQVGSTLTVTTNWSGTAPISYSFQWQRCNAQGSCTSIAGATGQSYVATTSDIGYRLRALVTAHNAYGTNSEYSNLTGSAVVAAAGKPALTAAPVVTGTAQVGSTLSTTAGTWSSATKVTYAYVWLRCDANGNACVAIGGATGTTRTLTSASLGHTVRSQVTATNSAGSTTALSAPHAVAASAPAAPTGVIPVAGGKSSISASTLSLPQRLVISGVAFSPSRLSSRAPFTARFRVMDTRGYVVRDALVYVVALPFGWTVTGHEVTTDTSGYATVVIHPTRAMPLRRGSLVLFVRARKQGGSLLAGVSTRRLVQVLIR